MTALDSMSEPNYCSASLFINKFHLMTEKFGFLYVPYVLLPTLAVHNGPITSCIISPNHQYLVTSSEDNHCRLWTIRSGNGEFIQGPKCKELFHNGKENIFIDADFSSDSCALVTATSNGQVRIWDTDNGTKGNILTIKDNRRIVSSLFL